MKKNEVKDGVKSLFRNGKTWVLIAALAGIALGLIMIINPVGFRSAIYYVLGVFLVLFGAISLVQVFRAEANSLRFGGLIPGVLSLAVGLAFIFRQEMVEGILWFFVGLIILVDAVYKLEHAFVMKAAGIGYWWVSLLDAILAMVLAVVVMISTPGEAMIVLAGVILLVNGLFDLAEFILLLLAGKQLKASGAVILQEGEAADVSDATEITPVDDHRD